MAHRRTKGLGWATSSLLPDKLQQKQEQEAQGWKRKGLFLPAFKGGGSEISQRRDDICTGLLKISHDNIACLIQEEERISWGKGSEGRGPPTTVELMGRGLAGASCLSLRNHDSFPDKLICMFFSY